MNLILLIVLFNLVQTQKFPEIKSSLLVETVLDSISKRESNFHIIGNKAYTLISSTNDYGKYQINGINFNKGGVCYGITYQQFLNNPQLQEVKTRELMNLHIKIIKQYGFTVSEERLHKSWFGISYALQ